MLAEKYLRTAAGLAQEIVRREMPAVRKVAQWCVDAQRAGKRLWYLDIGHFPPFETVPEREGNPRLFAPLAYRLEEVEKVGRGDVLVFGSILGVFALSVDICRGARERGAKVVYIGSPVDKGVVPPQHPSGERVADVVDLVIRTHVPYTDGVIDEAWLPTPACPLSGFANTLVFWMLNAEVLRLLEGRGK
ncbi:MAG: hypothetical protein ACUVSV_00765 [Armatimonadota bacterium]